MSNAYVRRVKTLTMREFFHSPGLAKSLHPGEEVVVTSNGKPDLVVTKIGPRPKKTARQLQEEAKALLDEPEGRKVDTVKFLRELRK
jgi:hypothetical protein